MTRLRIALALVVIASVSVPLAIAASRVPAAGCEPAEEPSFADDSFTPPEARLSTAQYPRLVETGTRIDSLALLGTEKDLYKVPAAPAGRSLQLMLVSPVDEGSAVAWYFASSPIDQNDTIEDFIDEGGVLVVERPAGGQDAQTVVDTVGPRATLVRVGEHTAAMVHADPTARGTRHFQIYWSDGVLDPFVIGNDRGSAIVNLARSLYCGVD